MVCVFPIPWAACHIEETSTETLTDLRLRSNWARRRRERGGVGVSISLSSCMSTGGHVSIVTPSCQSQAITNTDTNPKDTNWQHIDLLRMGGIIPNLPAHHAKLMQIQRTGVRAGGRLCADGWQPSSQLISHQSLMTRTRHVNSSVNRVYSIYVNKVDIMLHVSPCLAKVY